MHMYAQVHEWDYPVNENAVTLMLRQSCYEHEHIPVNDNAVVALMYAREILSKGRLKIRM